MNSTAPATEAFRADVNALRALAVVSVIAYHFNLPGAGSGYLGVDVFFVISGFLIGGQIAARIERGQFSALSFFAGRIRRIVPALAALCAVVLAWGFFFQLPDDFKQLSRSVQSALLFYSNNAFAKQLGYFDLGAAYKPLLHTWSLSVEAQFYLVLPFFLIGVARLPRALRWPVLAGVALLSFAFALHLGRESAASAFYSFPARAWEFMVGCAVAWATAGKPAGRRLPSAAREVLLALSWLGLAASCFLLPKPIAWPGAWTLVPTLLTAGIILLGTGRAAGRLVRQPALQHIGTISYSLYLWHWTLLVCWRLTAGTDPTEGLEVVVLIAATWALAWLSWRFVEQPLRQRPAWRGNASMFRFYGALLAVFAAVTVFISRTDGWPARLPGYLQGAHIASLNREALANCWHLPGAPQAGDPYGCDIGDPRARPPTFVVWGDSHALQYLGALRASPRAASLAGWLFHRPGCEPSLDGRAAGDPCTVHNERVLGLLQATPSIQTVVIAIRQNDPARVERSWAMARQLAARNIRVVFVGPLPEAPEAVAQEWARRQFVQRKPIADLTIGRAETTRVAGFDARLDHFQRTGAPVLAQAGGKALALDLSPLFCDAAQCWLVQGGVGWFRDADHLTPAAAARVAPLVFDAIAPAAR